jgi:hypothetical protein
MRLLNSALLTVAVTLIGVSTGHARDNRLRIDVSPHVSTAPANIRVVAYVEPNELNRGLQVTADSGSFYRSSFTPMEGLDAAEVTETTLKNLPGGQYEIAVALVDARGKLIVEHATVMVTSPQGR